MLMMQLIQIDPTRKGKWGVFWLTMQIGWPLSLVTVMFFYLVPPLLVIIVDCSWLGTCLLFLLGLLYIKLEMFLFGECIYTGFPLMYYPKIPDNGGPELAQLCSRAN